MPRFEYTFFINNTHFRYFAQYVYFAVLRDVRFAFQIGCTVKDQTFNRYIVHFQDFQGKQGMVDTAKVVLRYDNHFDIQAFNQVQEQFVGIKRDHQAACSFNDQAIAGYWFLYGIDVNFYSV